MDEKEVSRGKGQRLYQAAELVLLFALLLLSCGPSPQDLAEARAIERESQIQAEATRQAIQEQAEARAAAEARRQADWEDTRAAINSAKNLTLRLVSWSFASAISILFFVLIFRAWRFLGHINRKAMMRSLSIYPDPQTGQYPLLLFKGAIHDLNTGLVLRAGQEQPALEQLVASQSYARALTIAANGAVKVAEQTKDAQAGDIIFTAAGSIPQIRGSKYERERQLVAESSLPGWIKDRLDKRLEEAER